MKGGGTQQLPFYSSGSGTSSGRYDNTSTPIAPEGWVDDRIALRPGANGLTPLQMTGADWLQTQLAGGDPARLESSRGYFQDTLNNRTAPTLRNLAAIDPAAYGAPAPVTSNDITAREIAARRGAEFMADYQNPYTRDVIDASLNQYDADAAQALARLRGSSAGAFGNKRLGVAEGQFGADSALGRASLGAGLRADAFNTAAGLGMQDASRFLSADASNQAAALAAAQANQAAAQRAAEYNAEMTNRRQIFDASLGMDYNEQRDRVARDLAAIGTTGFNVGAGLASGVFDAGTTGQGQNIDWLNTGLPLFGSNVAGTNTGATTDVSSGYQTGQEPRRSIFGPLGTLATGLGGLGWQPFKQVTT